MLRKRGHKIKLWHRHNNEITKFGVFQKMALAWKTTHNSQTARCLDPVISSFKPDLAHVRNTFPLISPAVFDVLKKRGVPVVVILDNYRMFCARGDFVRKGRVCELCTTNRLAGLWHGCYRNSRILTLPVTTMQITHQILGTYKSKVDLYVAPTEFVRQKYIKNGIDPSQIVVKPHFLPDPGPVSPGGDYALFCGRISSEKGILTLIKAWQKKFIPLKVIGAGPLLEEAKALCGQSNNRNIDFLGQKSVLECQPFFRNCSFVVVPSECYECFGRVVMEAYAYGKPVIVSKIGALQENVTDGKTGLLFEPGNLNRLRACVSKLVNDPARTQKMGKRARIEYERLFTEEQNGKWIEKIYRSVITEPSGRAGDE